MDSDLRGLGETEFSVYETNCCQDDTPGHSLSYQKADISTEEQLKIRLRIAPPVSFCTENFPLSQVPTPFPLRSFEATYEGTIKMFQEEPSNFFENEIAELDTPKFSVKNARKRLAEDSASVNSVTIGSHSLSHKRPCPDDPTQVFSGDALQPSIENTNQDLPSSPDTENVVLIPSEPLDSDWALPSPTNSVVSYRASREPNIDIESLLSSGAAIESIPKMIQLFEAFPPQVQDYFMFQLLRRVSRPSLQFMSSMVVPHLKRNFIAKLPYEIAHKILEYMDAPTLCSASQVDRTWKHLIDSNDALWERRLKLDSLSPDPLPFNTAIIKRWKLGSPQERLNYSENNKHLVPCVSNVVESAKCVYARRYKTNRNWVSDQGRWVKFQTPNVQVITCLQFDDEKIVMGSEATTISVYHLRTGDLYKNLEGHDGGVWTLQFVANTLATGSTDRTVRIWDIKKGICTHVFTGHTSTVRCLQIVLPIEIIHKDSYGQKVTYEPSEPLVVTGSRDSTLRAWKLPSPSSDQSFTSTVSPPLHNPFFRFLMQGHEGSVRTLSAQGKYLASGSYDNSVRVWDLEKGETLWHFTGHTNKVYNVVMDRARLRCMSGSMDYTIRVWDIVKGTCFATLSGMDTQEHLLTQFAAHNSLVGLLQLSSDFLVSAAADATVRVWNPDTLECRHLMKGHQGAIMALHHDTNRVVSGSEGSVKLWDIFTGQHIRDLISGVHGVWQIKANEDVCVAAVNRGDITCIEIVDFSYRPPRISL